jgi:heme exporter protein B
MAFLLGAQVVALPAFALFFAPLDATALVGVLLADVGICAVGSLLSAMAAASRARELLLPLLVLPLSIPLVVGGVGASVSPEGGRYLLFLALYDAVFAVLSWASFEYVVTE